MSTAWVNDPLAHDDILTRGWAHSASVDEPVGFEDYTTTSGVGSGEEHAMYADRQGSVIWVTRPAIGDVAAAYEYDAYGQISQTQGSLSQPYGYTGREYDAESGLYHYRARAYDPASGVFVQSDPIGFGGRDLNVYGYVTENPLHFADPSGMMSSLVYRKFGSDAAASGLAYGTPIAETAIGLAGKISRALTTTFVGIDTMAVPEARIYDCDPKILKILQSIKPTRVLSCKGDKKDLTNLGRMLTISRAIIVRKAITEACYGGGTDATHGKGSPNGQLTQLYTQLANCERLILQGQN